MPPNSLSCSCPNALGKGRVVIVVLPWRIVLLVVLVGSPVMMTPIVMRRRRRRREG